MEKADDKTVSSKGARRAGTSSPGEVVGRDAPRPTTETLKEASSKCGTTLHFSYKVARLAGRGKLESFNETKHSTSPAPTKNKTTQRAASGTTRRPHRVGWGRLVTNSQGGLVAPPAPCPRHDPTDREGAQTRDCRVSEPDPRQGGGNGDPTAPANRLPASLSLSCSRAGSQASSVADR